MEAARGGGTQEEEVSKENQGNSNDGCRASEDSDDDIDMDEYRRRLRLEELYKIFEYVPMDQSRWTLLRLENDHNDEADNNSNNKFEFGATDGGGGGTNDAPDPDGAAHDAAGEEGLDGTADDESPPGGADSSCGSVDDVHRNETKKPKRNAGN